MPKLQMVKFNHRTSYAAAEKLVFDEEISQLQNDEQGQAGVYLSLRNKVAKHLIEDFKIPKLINGLVEFLSELPREESHSNLTLPH